MGGYIFVQKCGISPHLAFHAIHKEGKAIEVEHIRRTHNILQSLDTFLNPFLESC